MTPLNHFRFFRIWLAVVAGCLAVVAVFNMLVDPIGAFPKFHLRSLERYRPRVDTRQGKAELAHQSGWEIVTLGSSHVLGGLPADYPLFRSNRTVNLALTAPTLVELAAVLRTVRANNGKPPRLVILGLDYYMFSEGPDYILDFMETRFNPKFDRVDYYAKRLIGHLAVKESIKVIENRIAGRGLSLQDLSGFIKYRAAEDFSHRSYFEQIMRRAAPDYRSQLSGSASRLEVLRKIIRDCREQRIDLRLIIMPVHALELELLHACGKGESFENFKRSLVQLLAEEGLEGKVPLLDATGYAGPSAEEVPPADVHGLTMKYFVESTHATPVLGAMVLNRLFGTGGTNQFGVFLTSANIEGHLQQEHLDRAAYVRAHPVDSQWPQRIVESLPPMKTAAITDPAMNHP